MVLRSFVKINLLFRIKDPLKLKSPAKIKDSEGPEGSGPTDDHRSVFSVSLPFI